MYKPFVLDKYALVFLRTDSTNVVEVIKATILYGESTSIDY